MSASEVSRRSLIQRRSQHKAAACLFGAVLMFSIGEFYAVLPWVVAAWMARDLGRAKRGTA